MDWVTMSYFPGGFFGLFFCVCVCFFYSVLATLIIADHWPEAKKQFSCKHTNYQLSAWYLGHRKQGRRARVKMLIMSA